MIVWQAGNPDKLDALVVVAHPDDAEIGMGGTIALLSARGYAVGVADLTRGEAGSRGTPEERVEESRRASEVLGIAARFNMGLADGYLCDGRHSRRGLIRVIRQYRPRTVFAHYPEDPHPDHTAAFLVARGAAHNAGLGKIDPGAEPFRPSVLLSFCRPHRAEVSFVVDISDHWEAKRAAVLCHRTQVSPRKEGEPDTYLGGEQFMEIVEAHARSAGATAGVRYAEAFHSFGVLAVDDPIEAFRKKRGRLL